MVQEALARTRAAVASEEEVLAATQERVEEALTGDEGQVLSAADQARIAQNKEAAMERRRKKAESAPVGQDLHQCVICMGPIFLEDREETQWLPCTHVYHKECITTWADTRGVTLELACPQCKNKTLDVPGFVVPETGASGSSGSRAPEQQEALPAATEAEAEASAIARARAEAVAIQ